MITAKFNTQSVVDWCNRAASNIGPASKRGLKLGAQYGLDDSQKLVHVITGRLKASGGIKGETENSVIYGYDTPYAAAEEYGNIRRPAHPYIAPGYRTLANGLAADLVYIELNSAL
jgi:hypothetical protein